ncbi:MAG: hypothetical protein ABF586_07725 [Sporolactobacillus sp.]
MKKTILAVIVITVLLIPVFSCTTSASAMTNKTTFTNFEGTWHGAGHQTIYIKRNAPVVTKSGKTVKLSMISYSISDAAVAYVRANKVTIKKNKLIIKNATLIGDGNSTHGKVSQVLTLSKHGHELIVSNPHNSYIKSFHGHFSK